MSAALREWSAALGEGAVAADGSTLAEATRNTTGSTREVAAVLRPATEAEVIEAVRVACRHRVPVYPISRGRNWGYGSGLPVTDGCAILDLSRMDRVVHLDEELATVALEPGVTQEQLHRELEIRGSRFIVPTTGAGPGASVVGNALDRGYGLAPYADHFAAVTAVRAVLADGRVYRGALSELGAERVDGVHKWGLGPYVDGLFAQGSLGVVTQATVSLAPRPERVEAVLFRVDHDEALPQAVEAVREVIRRLGSVVTGINLMNDRRVLSMMEPYRPEAVGPQGVLPEAMVRRLARAHRLGRWTGFGALAGPSGVVVAARREVSRVLRPQVRGLRFVSLGQVRRVRRTLGRLPGAWLPSLRRQLGSLEQALQNVAGIPTEVALPLCYWRCGGPPAGAGRLDPARDGCGLIWYSPLVPMAGDVVRRYTQLVSDIAPRYGIEPLITLTSISDRCFDSTVPILFDPREAGAASRARACYEALFDAGRQLGVVPYRFGVDDMAKAVVAQTPFWSVVAEIKHAVDPRAILSPGRYDSTQRRA